MVVSDSTAIPRAPATVMTNRGRDIMAPVVIAVVSPRARPDAFLILCLSVALLPALIDARMCVGTNTAMSKVGQTTEDTYNFYKNMYSGKWSIWKETSLSIFYLTYSPI